MLRQMAGQTNLTADVVETNETPVYDGDRQCCRRQAWQRVEGEGR
jgi:hypothetical protein